MFEVLVLLLIVKAIDTSDKRKRQEAQQRRLAAGLPLGRAPLPPYLRAAVIARDGYVCQLCGGRVAPIDVHIDHIYPWSRGGPTVLSNLQVTHSRCNIRKGAR
jgi:5-methylcytosine-specific restriction endonuclease McrA